MGLGPCGGGVRDGQQPGPSPRRCRGRLEAAPRASPTSLLGLSPGGKRSLVSCLVAAAEARGFAVRCPIPRGGGSARRSPEGGRFSAAGRGRPRGRAAPGCVPPGSAARRPNRPPAPRFPAPSRGAHPGTPRPPLAGLSVGGQEPSPTLSLGGGAAFTARGWCRRVRRRTGLTFLRAHVRPTFPQEPREWERDAGRWAGLSRPAAPGSGRSGRQQSGLGTSGLS